jgi:molecular chaperone DnaK
MNKSNKEMSDKIVGIDLGTTNSCVSIIEGKDFRVLENPEGSRTTPSVVSYDKDSGRFLVGIAAKRQASINKDTIFSVKRKMGTSSKIIVGNENEKKQFSPEQISAEILSYLVKSAEEKLGEKINRVVITVPAYFNDAQRQATKDAGIIAGLKVERIINEPTAAALAYGFDKKEKEQKILVYDLGGGTFDVSILSISKGEDGGVFEVESTAGINTLGGDDFNDIITDYLLEEFRKANGKDLFSFVEEKNRITTLQRIKEASEQAKHELSNKFEARVSIPYICVNKGEPVHLNVEITRSRFEDLTKKMMEQTNEKITESLREANLKESDIDQVILVGGSTRMPMVENLVSKRFGESKINKTVNPDEVVAIGAAVQGAVLRGDVKDILLLDVVPMSLGIEVKGGLNDIIIPRNTTIPTEKTTVYSTAEDNQSTVLLRVLQGERPRSSDNRTLAVFELVGIEAAPRGVPLIEVKFSIDANGIVSVSAKDKKTNKEQSIVIKDSNTLSDEEIQRMTREAEENKVKDEEFKNNLQTLNKAEGYYYTFEKQLEEFKKNESFNESDESYQELKKRSEELKKSMDEKDYVELEKQLNKIDEFIKLANELSQKTTPSSKENTENSDSINVDETKEDTEDKKD